MSSSKIVTPSTKLNLSEIKFPFCEPVSKFEKLAKIGQGTFGEVFKAKEKKSGINVALKKILMENEKEGFPITALREVKILKMLEHENIVKLKEVSSSPPSGTSKLATFYLVFEFCEHDLAGLLSNSHVKFNLGEIKNVMQQLLNGLYYIHSNKILHRDLKASNVLITKNGTLKLADFGLARAFSTNRQPSKYTNRVVTLWYRPPELLLGERVYGPSVDLWGVGCIMAEMWTRTPILQGSSEIHQLILISKLCGPITKTTWPKVEEYELFKTIELPQDVNRRVRERLRGYLKDELALDLLENFLVLDPEKRITAATALDHDFFWSDPMPMSLSNMLSAHTTSMFEFLAPTRRPGVNRSNMQMQRPQQASSSLSTYHERVY